jgi:protein gp37
MNKTKIEWCDYTINNFWGCNNGCHYCAARPMARRFAERIGKARHYPPNITQRMKEFKPVFLADQLDKLYTIKKTSRIFMSMMGEPFSPEFNNDMPIVFQAIRDNPRHTVIMLTKQPQNLIKWSPFPDNCWVGVSATDQNQYLAGLRALRDIEATIKFFSFEPLLHRIDTSYGLMDWTIIGQQTPVKPATMPKIEWIQEIVEAADTAGVPVFLKDNLNKSFPLGSIGYDMDLFWDIKSDPKRRQLRQEFPAQEG